MYAPRIAPAGRARSVKRVKQAPKRRQLTGIPTQVRMGRQAIAKQLFNTLTYVETFTRTVSAGVNANYQFSCNGLYDPNITGTGHQPMYFDQIAALYNHYTVLRSRIRVTWSAINIPNPVSVALYIEDDTTSGTTSAADQAAERPGAKSGMFLPLAEGTITRYASWDAAKTFGPNPMAQEELSGTSATNPTEQSYYTIVNYFPAGDTITMVINVKIDYDVVWDEFITVAQS